MIKKISAWEEEVMNGKHRKAIPLMTHAGVELINRKISEAVKSGEIQFEALKALDKMYSPDAVCTVMDLTVEAEAFGCKVDFYEHEVPTVANGIVSDEAGVDNLKIPGLFSSRAKEYIKAVELSTGYFTEKPVFAGCIGPFSLAGRIFGMTEIMTSLLFEPEVIHKLVEKCTAFLKVYINEYKKSGANGIIIAEPAAGLLSGEQCDSFSSDFIRSVVDELQDPSFMIILHNCGNTGQVTQSMISTGARGLHFGNKIDLGKVLKEVPKNILVFGNVDPVGIFKMADPDTVTSNSSQLLESTSSYPNYIISSGCEIPPGVERSNFEAFFAAVKKYNSAK